jgi:hypothetical protein
LLLQQEQLNFETECRNFARVVLDDIFNIDYVKNSETIAICSPTSIKSRKVNLNEVIRFREIFLEYGVDVTDLRQYCQCRTLARRDGSYNY